MASSSEPTAPLPRAERSLVVANLGVLDSAVVERLERWATSSCVEHVLHRYDDGSVALYAGRTSTETVRQYQSRLRKLASNWQMPLEKLDRG